MIKKSIRVTVVGLQYYPVTTQTRTSIQQGSPLNIQREFNNPHDRNAMKVLCSGEVVGYLSRDDALKLSKIIDAGVQIQSAKYSQKKTMTPASKAFSASIMLALPDKTLKPLKSIGAFPGIYKIESKPDQKSYIGQAQNIDRRVGEHRVELTLGVHSNADLQALWDLRNPKDFRIAVVEKAPENLNAYELQEWLAEKERYWIDKERKERRSLNILDGEFVYTKQARDVEKENLEKFDRAVRIRKREIREELKLIEPEYNKSKWAINSLIIRQRELAELRHKHSGLMKLFYGSGPGKNREDYDAEILRIEKDIQKAREAFEPIRKRRDALLTERKSLKTIKQMESAVAKLSYKR